MRYLYRRDAFQRYEGATGTLASRNVNSDVITKSDLKAYNHILELTNAHLEEDEPVDDIQISRG